MSIQYYLNSSQSLAAALDFETNEVKRWQTLGASLVASVKETAEADNSIQDSIDAQQFTITNNFQLNRYNGLSHRAFANVMLALEWAAPDAQTNGVKEILYTLDEMDKNPQRDFYINLLSHTGAKLGANNQSTLLTWLIDNAVTSIDAEGNAVKAHPQIANLLNYDPAARTEAAELFFDSVHAAPYSKIYDDKLIAWALNTLCDEGDNSRLLGEISIPYSPTNSTIWVAPRTNNQSNIVLCNDQKDYEFMDVPSLMDQFNRTFSGDAPSPVVQSLIRMTLTQLSDIFTVQAEQKRNQPELQSAINQALIEVQSLGLK